MSAESEDKPFSESHLDSPEYRERLQRKLNTLIAVIEVACVKVDQSLQDPKADLDRLERIRKNLRETLAVCRRAKKALERCEELPKGLPESLTHLTAERRAVTEESQRRAPAHVEMSSDEEAAKFKALGPIDPKEVRSIDLNDLARQLLEGGDEA